MGHELADMLKSQIDVGFVRGDTRELATASSAGLLSQWSGVEL